MSLAIFGWSEAQFWASTPQSFAAALVEYNRVFGTGSEPHKRREFADFKKGVEKAEAQRRSGRKVGVG